MLGIPLRYLLRHPRALADLAAHPLEVATQAVDVFVAGRESRRPECHYTPDQQWEARLHHMLGADWPCRCSAEFRLLWDDVLLEMEVHGVRAGPQSFGSWNDGDAGLARAVWCLTRHLQPDKVVETGVAHGVTSRFVLEALERNRGGGHLWSIDLPPLEKSWREQVGIAVGQRFANRWTYIRGSSRLRLRPLLRRMGRIDLFIHDSMHTERNVRFELDHVWPVLRPGGAAVVDDIDANWGFRSFTERAPGPAALIGEAEPTHPDLRRFNQKGLFGIVLNRVAGQAQAA